MKENLNIGTMINISTTSSDDGIIEKYCYGNNTILCESYGGLYLWDEVMQYDTNGVLHGICPTGWHIPTDDDWKILEGSVDSQFGIGDPEWNKSNGRGFDVGPTLRSTYDWVQGDKGTDLFGFTALPSGWRFYSYLFFGSGKISYIWTSNEVDGSNALSRKFFSCHGSLARSSISKQYGVSVRCLKD